MSIAERPKLTALTFVAGVLTLAVGIVTIATPALARTGREWLIAVVLLLSGLTSAGFAITTLRRNVRTYTSLLALLSIATALVVLNSPLDTFITLTTLMGVYFTMESVLMGGLGMSLLPHRAAASCVLGLGAVSLIMSALIWLKLAGASQHIIVMLVGVTFVARGVMYLTLAVLIKGRAPLTPEPEAPTLEDVAHNA